MLYLIEIGLERELGLRKGLLGIEKVSVTHKFIYDYDNHSSEYTHVREMLRGKGKVVKTANA